MPINVTKRFESLLNRGISKKEVSTVVREAVQDRLSADELAGFRAALGRFEDQFTPDGQLELKRFVAQNHKPNAAPEFEQLKGLAGFERSATLLAKWGATSKYDPSLPTFEKPVASARVPKLVRDVAAKEAQRQSKLHAGGAAMRQVETTGLYDLNRRLVGYRVAFDRPTPLMGGEFGRTEVFLKKDGTLVNSKNAYAPRFD